ncbi:EVE domain-containing protein [Thermococcus argininiproducens]|uniref:UPF0310 protein K1720_00675 n=1 Tax=Thermococcus argininiproducens TaxID=2866384 RepID=A0A9E7MB82_9EURY|nr:EVE domain-containing protein [Thermococcus argininiproducens]USH00038.1 EVE domain-containing protein [Thermococcus argininiproducens]
MPYWLCITNRENWKIIKNNNIWGVPEKRHKNTLLKVKPKDKVIIYIKQEKDQEGNTLEPKIVAIYEVVSEPFKDSKKVFKAPKNSNETYPWRIKLKLIKSGEIEFKPLIPKLSFIKNKKKWSTHLFGKAMREIPEEDYKLIEKLL